MTYKYKQFFPELSQKEFNDKIIPILPQIKGIINTDLNNQKKLNIKYFNGDKENYPYQNVLLSLAIGIWNKEWNSKLNSYLSQPSEFQKAICDSMSQIAFSYLIRCFATQIKTFKCAETNEHIIYQRFSAYLVNNSFNDFSNSFPIIWHRTLLHLSKIIKSTMAVIEDIEDQREMLFRSFNISRNAKIKCLSRNGDTHYGKSVCVVTFDNNSKIVYKPRNIVTDVAYAELVRKINVRLKTNFKATKAVSCKGIYGFTEYIQSDKNSTSQNMFKVGELACLMYLLNASDMHFENIVWKNGIPVPIDLETLFQPRRVRIGMQESPNSAYAFLEKSVYGTGILPITIGTRKDSQGIDVGFAGLRDKNNEGSFKSFIVRDGFTSNIKVVWEKPIMKSNNLITDSTYRKIMKKRCDEMVRGYSSFFNKIISIKDDFKKWCISLFRNCTIRYIHNMTYRYEQILRVLTDSTAGSSLQISQLLMARLQILSLTSSESIVLSEIRQIYQGDIPYFNIEFSSRQIKSAERKIVKALHTPQEDFLLKINQLGKDELLRQINIIKLAFMSKTSDPDIDNTLDENRFEKYIDSEISIKEIISDLIGNINRNVLDDRFKHLPKTWVGPVAQGNSKGWSPGVLGYDLYAGRVGPALALALASKYFKINIATDLAVDIFEKSANILVSDKVEKRSLLEAGTGAYSGVTGLLWSLYVAGKILDKPKWVNAAQNSWFLLDDSLQVINSNFFDMISGNSGAIIMRYRMTGELGLSCSKLEKIFNLADYRLRLLENGEDQETSIGIAHGFSQIIWFLAIIVQATNNPRAKAILRRSITTFKLSYEDQGRLKTYPIRSRNNKDISSSWCNGISGVLLAIYEAYKANCIDKKEVIKILNLLKEKRITKIPILCHGSLGIYEVLRYIRDDFALQVDPIIARLRKTSCSPQYIWSYYSKGRGRYPLSMGLMCGKAGAIFCICQEWLDIYNPLTLSC